MISPEYLSLPTITRDTNIENAPLYFESEFLDFSQLYSFLAQQIVQFTMYMNQNNTFKNKLDDYIHI